MTPILASIEWPEAFLLAIACICFLIFKLKHPGK
jgi:hypothetical protein